MTLLTEAAQSPLIEVIAGVVTAVIFGIWRLIEKGNMESKQRRALRKAELMPPPVDAPEQLAQMAAEDKAAVDSISKFVKPIVAAIATRKK